MLIDTTQEFSKLKLVLKKKQKNNIRDVEYVDLNDIFQYYNKIWVSGNKVLLKHSLGPCLLFAYCNINTALLALSVQRIQHKSAVIVCSGFTVRTTFNKLPSA